MSKRCPECHFVNDDSRIFCASCGATLDPQLRLIQELERQNEQNAKKETPRQRREVNFYGSRKPAPPKKKKSSPLPWVILLLAAAAVVIWLLVR